MLLPAYSHCACGRGRCGRVCLAWNSSLAVQAVSFHEICQGCGSPVCIDMAPDPRAAPPPRPAKAISHDHGDPIGLSVRSSPCWSTVPNCPLQGGRQRDKPAACVHGHRGSLPRQECGKKRCGHQCLCNVKDASWVLIMWHVIWALQTDLF